MIKLTFLAPILLLTSCTFSMDMSIRNQKKNHGKHNDGYFCSIQKTTTVDASVDIKNKDKKITDIYDGVVEEWAGD